MWYAIYLCCLLIIGFAWVARLYASHSRIELAGLAACLGPGLAGLALIAISMFGSPPTPDLIFLLTIIFGFIALFTPRRASNSMATPAPLSVIAKCWIALCLGMIAYGIFAVIFNAVRYPEIEPDAYAMWQLKAKVLATHALSPRPDYFSDVSLSFSHLRYPILVPMISAGVFVMTGLMDGHAGKIPFVMMYIGLGMAVFGAIKSWRGPVAAATAAALLMTTPVMLNYADTATAEMALTAFYGCSIISILHWQKEQHLNHLILALLFTLCMAWTKNEGIMLALINCFVILTLTPKPLQRRHFIAGIGFVLVLSALYAPWVIFTHDLPRTDENYSQHLNVAEIASKLSLAPYVLGQMFVYAAGWKYWGLFWFLPIGTAILSWRRLASRPILTLWVLLVLQMLAYIPPYLVTQWNLQNLILVTMDRLLLHAAPAAALLIGLQWPNLPNSGQD
jgi:hypothetical protein